MGLYGPGSMTSTHSASPLPTTAAIESIKLIQKENLVENSRKLGEILVPEIKRIQQKYPDVLGCAHDRHPGFGKMNRYQSDRKSVV